MPNKFKKQFEILKHRKQLLIILIFLLVLIVVWTVVSISASQQELVISKQLTNLAKPLVPNIDIEVIDEIEEKRDFTDDELEDFPIYKILQQDKNNKSARLVKIDYVEAEAEDEQSSGNQDQEEAQASLSTKINDQADNGQQQASPSAIPSPPN